MIGDPLGGLSTNDVDNLITMRLGQLAPPLSVTDVEKVVTVQMGQLPVVPALAAVQQGWLTWLVIVQFRHRAQLEPMEFGLFAH